MRKSSLSLTVQMGALLAGLAVLVFFSVGFYLFQALASQLRDRDDVELRERLAQVQHLLEETSNADAIATDPHRFLDVVEVRRGLLLVIRDSHGADLMANTPDRSFIPPQGSGMANVRRADGAEVRVLAGTGRVGKSGQQVQLILARSDVERSALLKAYQVKVLSAAVAGALLSATLGFFLVRHGLGKVRALASQARQVTAHNLAIRLDAESAPEELRLLADSFNEVLERLQASFDSLSQFADDLAHDLRTPLNNMMLQTEVLLAQPRSTDDYQQLLASNHEEAARLARMVESILFLARADHDQVSLSTESLDAKEELERIAEYFEGPASDVGVRFSVAATGHVTADPQLLRRAVSNLVANAVRYTPPEGGIMLEANVEGPAVAISVTNPGPGIDAADLPRIFDRFYRSDKARSSKSSSAGLGLAIVKSIMALHRGQVTVHSVPHGLTRFTLIFPG